MNEPARKFDRSAEDIGNIVELGHVNITVPDLALANTFYVAGLGLTRDPYLNTGNELMWVNVGRSQFHLPRRGTQVVPGTIGLVVPDVRAARERLEAVSPALATTAFRLREFEAGVAVTCPWGNEFRLHAPDADRFGPMLLGMPYVELDVPAASPLDAIASFYRDILGAVAGIGSDERGSFAWVIAGIHQRLVFRHARGADPRYDRYHIQITVSDFSSPYRRLRERGLVSEESDQHQYRFEKVIDPGIGTTMFQLEHEVRSMKHPLYGRPLVNRNPGQSNRYYAPGFEEQPASMPLR
jgi:catechol 2,3-dioxygenase-like lactoylglutathione lyase family enzyme